MCIAKIEAINEFLWKFKFFAQNFTQFTVVERDKYLATLASLGITSGYAYNTILKLTYRKYNSGPAKDHLFPKHNVWTFGDSIEEKEVYIKLSDNFSCNVAKCISFHTANFPISYPYCGKKGGEML